ncbi:hypothetical protein FB45DRAFT_1054226, partial [Roridomyces roridus]
MSSVSMRLASNQAWLPLHSRDCTSTVYQQIVQRVNGRTSRAAASPQVNHRIAALALLLTLFAQIHALLQVPCRTAVFTRCNLFCTAVLSLPLSSSWLSMLCRVPWLHVAGELCC